VQGPEFKPEWHQKKKNEEKRKRKSMQRRLKILKIFLKFSLQIQLSKKSNLYYEAILTSPEVHK
jgi:hypothetical protein